MDIESELLVDRRGRRIGEREYKGRGDERSKREGNGERQGKG